MGIIQASVYILSGTEISPTLKGHPEGIHIASTAPVGSGGHVNVFIIALAMNYTSLIGDMVHLVTK